METLAKRGTKSSIMGVALSPGRQTSVTRDGIRAQDRGLKFPSCWKGICGARKVSGVGSGIAGGIGVTKPPKSIMKGKAKAPR